MSFSDIKYRIETGFIEPLQDFRQKTASLNTIHNDSLTKFYHNIDALLSGTDGQTAFQGTAAGQLGELVSRFLHNERKLSGQSSDARGWDLTGRLGDAGSKSQQWAAFFETVLDSIQHAPETSTHGIDQAAAGVGTFAVTMDGGAIAQGGVDIPWDIIAGAASGLALGLMLGDALIHAINNSDLQRAIAATAILDQTIPKIRQDYETIESDNPLPPELPSPRGPQGDFKTFLAILGITVTATGLVFLAGRLPVEPSKKISKLTPEELEKLKEYLSEELGCSPTQIQKIIEQIEEQDPTAAQLQQLLEVLKVKAQLEALKQELENSPIPGAKNLLESVKGDLESIDDGIKYGTWIKWTPSMLRGWQGNLNGYAYQWQAAQSLNARGIESSQVSIGADVISDDNIWYEVKNVPNITRGSDTYEKILVQLKKYADEQSADAHGIGVVAPPGADWNLGNELLKDLKSDNPKDPKITRLSKIFVKFLSPTLPHIPGNRWCRF